MGFFAGQPSHAYDFVHEKRGTLARYGQSEVGVNKETSLGESHGVGLDDFT
jgi:hypothetical protein